MDGPHGARERCQTRVLQRRPAADHDLARQESTLAGTRFLQLSDVAEILNISGSQAYALVRSG